MRSVSRSCWLALLLLVAPQAVVGATLDSIYVAPTLELAPLERVVIERNPSLAAMRSAWAAMEARAQREGAWDDPMLDVMVAPRSLGSSSKVDAGYSVQLAQGVPLFGQHALRGRAARAIARSGAAEYRAMRLDLLAEVRRLYFEYYLAARGVEINRELGDLLEQFRRVALQKYASGAVGQQDALQAEVELAMLDHERVALDRTRRILAARLRALLHDESARTLPEPPRELPPHVHAEHADSNGVSAAALTGAFASREELQGSVAIQEAKAAELSLARRARLPDLTLLARYDRFMEEPEWRPMVGLGFQLPFGFGRAGAGVREARAELDRAANERAALLDSIRAEIESASARVEESGHELAIITSRVLPATERALTSLRTGYESNRSDFLALLNAERNLARARLDRYRAETEYRMALADLDRALGVAPVWLPREARP